MSLPVDLRSDTLTLPTEPMRKAMYAAEVGDDVFGEDPSIRALEGCAAERMGLEAGLFVPSGTMGNQVALLTHCRLGDDVLIGEGAHSFLYEAGGAAAIAGVQMSTVGRGGHFTPAEVADAVQEIDPGGHVPPTRLLMVENTHNKGGGKVMGPETFAAVVEVARGRGLKVHVDGARLFNAATACDVPVSAWGHHADSISFCLSKGLGAPVGSVLCGSADFIHRAHRFRKMLGGGMRQAGILAAAGLYALEHHVQDLVEDHRRARELAEALANMSQVTLDATTVESNIVVFSVPRRSPDRVCEAVAPDVRVLPFGPQEIRAVLHRDIDDQGLEAAITGLARELD